MISAHWEETAFTVMTSPAPGMLYDYGGFPPHTYEVTYPAPGDPVLAERVVALKVLTLDRPFDLVRFGREATLLAHLRRSFPNVRDVHLARGGVCRYHLYVQITKRQEGEAKNVMMATRMITTAAAPSAKWSGAVTELWKKMGRMGCQGVPDRRARGRARSPSRSLS